jgi:hypothetical protein
MRQPKAAGSAKQIGSAVRLTQLQRSGLDHGAIIQIYPAAPKENQNIISRAATSASVNKSASHYQVARSRLPEDLKGRPATPALNRPSLGQRGIRTKVTIQAYWLDQKMSGDPDKAVDEIPRAGRTSRASLPHLPR